MPISSSVKGVPAACLCAGLILVSHAFAQGPPHPPPNPSQGIRFITSVGDGVVFFFEDGNDPDTGAPMPPPSIPLAPITEAKTIDFQTGSVVVPGRSVSSLLQVDVYLRQRYFYRNDGQGRFRVHSNPYIQIESPVFDDLTDPVTGQPLNGVWKISVFGNGLHLAAAKSLAASEDGNDSRGNFGRVLITKAALEQRFGPGTAARVFANDLTIRMSVISTVQGLEHFVVGTFSWIYGS